VARWGISEIEMERVATERHGGDDARMSLATWLRSGRTRRKLSIEDVARITKIQVRILEKLESGQLEGLPADVFVKGFVRSYAKCVGLDEAEALDKYSAAQALAASGAVATGSGSGGSVAKAMVETLARPLDINAVLEARIQGLAQGTIPPTTPPVEATLQAAIDAPLVIEEPIEIETPVVTAAIDVETAKKQKHRRRGKQRNRKRKQAQATKQDAIETAVFGKQDIDTGPAASIVGLGDGESVDVTSIEAKTTEMVIEAPAIEPITAQDGVVATETLAAGSDRMSAPTAVEPSPVGDFQGSSIVDELSELVAEAVDRAEFAVPADPVDRSVEAGEFVDEIGTGTWQPTMPPIPPTSSAPWRRPMSSVPAATTYVVPTLVIDDSDPDSADRERDDRVKEHRSAALSFLPPILLDREDRSTRQGGLTLAVIILLIAATLTLSYLMRRPSPSGDGVTMLPAQPEPATFVV
jgi:hypothetical protein